MPQTRPHTKPLQTTALTGETTASTNSSFTQIGAEIVSTVLANYTGPIAIRLWDGMRVQGAFDAPCTVVFKEPGALRDLVLHRNLLRLAESYLAGSVDVEGDMGCLFGLSTCLISLNLSPSVRWQLLRLALSLPKPSSVEFVRNHRSSWRLRHNSRASIAHHYDVSNDFYRLWLDPEMVYSCAYFRNTDQSLEQAQQDKLDYLCRKLRLKPDQTLLDIGCGWGGLALWAARHYGVRVRGITLSHEQQRFAQEKVRQAGLRDQVQIDFLDYRDLSDDTQYDRVISVGMFEHIGIKNFPVYFGAVRRVLKPGGLFLNHGITREAGKARSPMTRFMSRHVFPDGELARVSDVCSAMEQAGFEILDIENLRRHYALTLRHWVRQLEARYEQAIGYSSDVTFRLWRLYMTGCAFYFDEGSIGLHQILVGHQHQLQPVPLRRDDLYC